MDYLIWVVAIALFGYVFYAMFTDPPSSGCLSADLARALDEKRAAERLRRKVPPVEVAAPVGSPAEPAAVAAPSEEPAAPSPAPAADVPSDMLRNPLTGESAAVPTNYRFAKRWVKEALVAEGLLDKVYTNAELEAGAAGKVREALAAFKKLAKYRA